MNDPDTHDKQTQDPGQDYAASKGDFVQARDSLIALRRERLARAIRILRENGFEAEERLAAWGREGDVTKPQVINLLA